MAVSWLPSKNSEKWLKTIFCLLILNYQASAQQPGGVKGTKLWYIAQKGVPNFLIDTSGNHYPPLKFQTAAINNRNFNFHDAVFFPSFSAAIKNIPYKNFDGDQLTIVAIFYPKQVPNWKKTPYFLAASDENGNNQIFYNNIIVTDIDKKEKKYSYGDPTNRTTFEIDDKYTTLHTAMKSGVFHVSTRDLNYSVWGEEKNLTIAEWFSGYIPELMIYHRVLSPAEIIKVQTYLAVKYGITLDSSYILPNGINIWNNKDSLLNPFHHRVCVIAKDIAAAIFQPKSNSSYEEGYLSFEHDAAFNNTHFNTPNNIMIPSTDSPSVFHSVTIGFTDMQTVPDVTYLIWGDNDAILPTDPLVFLDSLNQIKVVNRIWLLKNPSNTTPLLKIMLAGQSYYKDAPKSRMTIFEKIYQPFDYQFYRYLLIPLKSPNIKDTAGFILNSYFGREQESNTNAENFNTRFVVWDSVSFHKPNDIRYFTFGKVPLLSFWEVIKKRGPKTERIVLKYSYDRNQPLQTQTRFDTAVADYRTNDSIQIKLSLGVAPVTVRMKEDKVGASWTNIQNNTAVPGTDTGTESTTTTITSENENSTEEKHGDKRYIAKRPWKKGLPFEYLKLQSLKTNTSYIIEARDRLGQISTLQLRLKSVTSTTQH